MALLTMRPTVAMRSTVALLRRRPFVPAVVLAVAFVAGCSLMGIGKDAPYAFSHQAHVGLEGLDCSVCHKLDGDQAVPTLPEPGLCLLCHKEMDAEKPQERRIHVLFENDVYKATHASRLATEVIFDHASHVRRDADCASCHVGIVSNERLTSSDAISMEDCMECHASYQADQSCSVCHTEIDQAWQPKGHEHEWTRAHGLVVRANVDIDAQRCTLCHTQSTCIECHQSEMPINHDNTWRLRGHGFVAALDRQNCATCHRDDYCFRCHQEVRPISHNGTYGSPRNTHCAGCHFPITGEGCVTCHKSAPSHQMATPLPLDHNTAMNCRQCHGAGVPLLHFDDGSSCILCHR